jgi:hypothetical protein
MPERSELVAEAQQLVELYREIANQTPTPQDLHSVGFALGRALEALERQGARESLERAAAEIAAARETLARVRRALDR